MVNPAWIIVVLATVPVMTAHAQLRNGDFENGSDGWTVPPTEIGVSFSGTGGNPGGCAFIGGQNLASCSKRGCIEQTFACGDSAASDSCLISFDFYVVSAACFDTDWEWNASVWADGTRLWNARGGNGVPWTRVDLVVGSGVRTIRACGQGINGPSVRFDNFQTSSLPQVPVINQTWSGIKTRYR